MAPPISVLITTYNGQRFLQAALASLAKQTFTDFEVIVVDDGSQDTTVEIIQQFVQSDTRFQYVGNDRNYGIPYSLNRALLQAQGAYIAILDQDDVALPTRLEKMRAYLESHQEVGMLGSWVLAIDEHDDFLYVEKTVSDPALQLWKLMFGTPIIHPTTLYRREWAMQLGAYDEADGPSAGYGMISRFARHGVITNYAEALTCKRTHADQATQQYRQEITRETGCRIAADNIAYILGESLPEAVLSGFLPETQNRRESVELTQAIIAAYQAVYGRYLEKIRPPFPVRAAISRDLSRLIHQKLPHLPLTARLSTYCKAWPHLPPWSFIPVKSRL